MMDYHELINELSYEDNPYVLDYIDDAVEMLEHLYSELKAANARCETLNKMVTQYQDELIPGYRERAEKAERERDAAVEAVKNMAEYIVCVGRVDYFLCDDISMKHHLKYQPKNDGNYENAPCYECIADWFLQGNKWEG